MSSIEESIIATQRSIITIQDELNATNDSIIALLKVDNARLEESIVLLTAEMKTIKDMYHSRESDLNNYINDTHKAHNRIAKELCNL